MLEVYPFRDSRKDSVQFSLSAPPGDDDLGCTCMCSSSRSSSSSISGKGAAIRRLFAQWERCLMRDHELLQQLQELLGRPLPADVKRLLLSQGPGGSVKFCSFMKALMADSQESAARGLGVSRKLLDAATAEAAAERHLLGDPQRDPVAWLPAAAAAAAGAAPDEPLNPAFVRLGEAETGRTEEGEGGGPLLPPGSRRLQLLRTVSLFLEGAMGAEAFRDRLVAFGCCIHPALDACIRQQAASGGVSFQRLMGAVSQQTDRPAADGPMDHSAPAAAADAAGRGEAKEIQFSTGSN
ncbi:hypothetical protein Efla_000974 [Eimeria flavescens]